MGGTHSWSLSLRRLGCPGLGAIALVFVLAACASLPSPASDGSTPVPTVAASPTPVPSIALEPCALGPYAAECGTLPVYENRATQSGRRISLRVGVIRAQSPQPALDAIFYLSGGPGGTATEDAPSEMVVLGLANLTRDIVFVDQRGTGGSNKLECPMPSDPTRQADELRACLANLDADPRAYTTAWAMDDLDDVRAALGYDKIDLYGGSYGATAAQVYILRHGEHVRTAFLDGGSLLDVPMFERFPVSSQSALEKLLARCEADTACRAEFPQLRAELAELLQRLGKGPIETGAIDPSTGEPILLTHEALAVGIHQLLVNTPNSAALPKVIHTIYSEDWAGVEALLASMRSEETTTPAWKVMSLTIMCHEDWAKLRPAETKVLAAGSYMWYSDVRALILSEDICAVVPQPEPAALYGTATGSVVPMLLVNGEADPQDPPANVAGAKQLYPNSLAVVFPGQAHQHTGANCLASIVSDFVESGSTEGLDTECLSLVPLPSFVP